MQLLTWQKSESLHFRLDVLDFISFLYIKLDRGDLLKAKPLTSQILRGHLSQTHAMLAGICYFQKEGENGAGICYFQKEGENGASLPKVFSPQTRGKEECAREQLVPWLHIPYSKWSECSERRGWSQSANLKCTLQPCYFPATWQNIKYTALQGKDGRSALKCYKRFDLTATKKAQLKNRCFQKNRTGEMSDTKTWPPNHRRFKEQYSQM